MTTVDVTFRKVDEGILREFKAQAILENKTFGEAATEAFQLWVKHCRPKRKK